MILTTNTTIAIQCSQCGELEFHALSLFAFSRQGRKNLHCGCGRQLMSVTSRNRRQFNVAYACAYCGDTHYLKLNHHAIWGKEALPLTCPDVGASVQYIQPKQKVTHACCEREKSIGELGNKEEFDNPQVMLWGLDHRHRLAKQEDLGSACGNHQPFTVTYVYSYNGDTHYLKLNRPNEFKWAVEYYLKQGLLLDKATSFKKKAKKKTAKSKELAVLTVSKYKGIDLDAFDIRNLERPFETTIDGAKVS